MDRLSEQADGVYGQGMLEKDRNLVLQANRQMGASLTFLWGRGDDREVDDGMGSLEESRGMGIVWEWLRPSSSYGVDYRCVLGCQEGLGADGGRAITSSPVLHLDEWGAPQG